jgi:predicted aconitase
MAKTETKPEMLSTGKVAEKIGVSAAKVKKAITELNLEPDMVKCGCNYFGAEKISQIEKAVK